MALEFEEGGFEFFGGGDALEGAVDGFLELQGLVDGGGEAGDAVELLGDGVLGLGEAGGGFFLRLKRRLSHG